MQVRDLIALLQRVPPTYDVRTEYDLVDCVALAHVSENYDIGPYVMLGGTDMQLEVGETLITDQFMI